MSLTLHYLPLASFCHKVLIALYEAQTPFTPHLVDLMAADARPYFAMFPFRDDMPARFLGDRVPRR